LKYGFECNPRKSAASSLRHGVQAAIYNFTYRFTFFPPLSHECLLQVLRFSDLGPALGFFGGDLVLEESDIELFGDGSLQFEFHRLPAPACGPCCSTKLCAGNASLGKYRLIRLEGSRLDVVITAHIT
jgi:hypothetical protein